MKGGETPQESEMKIKRKIPVITAALILCSGSGIASAQSSAVSGPPDLLEEALFQYSTDDGETFSETAPVLGPRESARILIRATFDLLSPPISFASGTAPFAALELNLVTVRYEKLDFSLNGQMIEIPLEGMFYRTIPGISPQLLKRGENILLGDFTIMNRSGVDTLTYAPQIQLIPLESRDLSFQIGPIMGAFNETYFSVTCTTNMPVPVSVYRMRGGIRGGEGDSLERIASSEAGLIHRFRISRWQSETPQVYAVVAEHNGFMVGKLIKPPAVHSGRFTFAAVGDSRTRVEDWRAVASAVGGCGAELVLHAGDIVSNGTRNWQWSEQFWEPGIALLSKIPVYPVIGNHEAEAPFFDEIFYAPVGGGRARNWSQELHGVLFIGIDGQQDWSAESENAAWLEETLSRSEANFIFLISHYPAWSSADHGSLNEEGIPEERPVREGREVIMPLLQKYGATAMIAGHDHTYERSEPPGGVSHIISGGGGAPRYQKTEEAEIQNPHSKVFESVLHYGLFEIEGDICTMKVYTPEGDIIDTRSWQARIVR